MSSYTVKTDSTIGLGVQRGLARKSDGSLWVAYYRNDTGGVNQIFVSYSTNGGQNWTEEQVTFSSYDQYNPSIAIDSADNVHIVWWGNGWGINTGYQNLQYRKRTTSWQTQETVTDITAAQWDPSIAIDSSDNVHVVWSGSGWGTNTSYDNIQYRKRTTSWQTQEAVTDKNADQSSGSIAIDSSDNVHIAWFGNGWGTNTGWDNLQYRKRTTSWQTQEAITDSGKNQYGSSIAIDSSDNVHVVWYGGGWDTYPLYFNVEHRKRTTSWQTRDAVTDSDVGYIYPSLIWALCPTVDGIKTNRTKAGYAVIYYCGTGLIYYASSDLVWEEAAGPPHIKTINGLAIASVKTINGLALASIKSWNGLS